MENLYTEVILDIQTWILTSERRMWSLVIFRYDLLAEFGIYHAVSMLDIYQAWKQRVIESTSHASTLKIRGIDV